MGLYETKYYNYIIDYNLYSDKLLSCDECWKAIFAEENSFVGALSFEQLPNRHERMIRIHPCQNNHFLDQFSQSKNQLKFVLSVLLQPFFESIRNLLILLPTCK